MNDTPMTPSNLCPVCGAYWPCDHAEGVQPAEQPLSWQEERPRYRSIVKQFYRRNVEAGTLPQEYYDLFFPEDSSGERDLDNL
jgi:hypothetical protein